MEPKECDEEQGWSGVRKFRDKFRVGNGSNKESTTLGITKCLKLFGSCRTKKLSGNSMIMIETSDFDLILTPSFYL